MQANESQRVDEHVATFDDLDFNVFSKQRWDDFRKSHAPEYMSQLGVGA